MRDQGCVWGIYLRIISIKLLNKPIVFHERKPQHDRRNIMISYYIKGIIIDIGLFLLNFLPKIGKIKRLHRILYLRKLLRTDGPAATAEYWRDAGMKVGKGCRIYSIYAGTERF